MHYHTQEHGGNPVAFKRAFGYAVGLALRTASKGLLLRVNLLDNTRGMISNLIGRTKANRLVKDKHLSISWGGNHLELYLESDRAPCRSFPGSVVLLSWLSSSSLSGVLASPGQNIYIYVPWMETERDEYLANYPTSIPI
jgi:hypothetical protein